MRSSTSTETIMPAVSQRTSIYLRHSAPEKKNEFTSSETVSKTTIDASITTADARTSIQSQPRPSFTRRLSVLLGLSSPNTSSTQNSSTTSFPFFQSRNASSASISLAPSANRTPPNESVDPQAEELAGSRRQRRKEEMSHVEKVIVFPGWSVVRIRPDNPSKKDIHMYVSGFCTSLRPVERSTRTQKVFTKMARGFAALPKLPSADLVDLSPTTLVASEDAPPVPDIPAQFSSGAGRSSVIPLADETSEPLVSDVFDNSFPSQGKHNRKLSLPAIFGFNSKLQSSDIVLVQEPESIDTILENNDAEKSPTHRHPHLHAIANKLFSGYTISELRKLHHNLDARLQPFWSNILSNREVRMSIGPANDPDVVWISQKIICDSCGFFKSRLQIPMEDLANFDQTLEYKNNLRVEVELLPIVSKKNRSHSLQEHSISRDNSPQRTFSTSSMMGSRSTSPVIPPIEMSRSPIMPGLVFDHIPRTLSPEPQSILINQTSGEVENLQQASSISFEGSASPFKRLSMSSTNTSRSQGDETCSTASRSMSSRSDSAISFTSSGLGARDSAILPLTRDKGIRVLSDLDDTVKKTGITTGLRNVFKNVFVKHVEDLVLDDMGDWYRGMEIKGARGFHYCSNGPFELFHVTQQFFSAARLPPGSLRLKYYGGKTLFQSIWQPAAVRKRAGVIDVLDEFLGTKFILIGDSGEQDMELYTAVAHERPEQVAAIFIRDVSTPDGVCPHYMSNSDFKSDLMSSKSEKSRPSPRRAFSDPPTPVTIQFHQSMHAINSKDLNIPLDSVSKNGHVSMSDVSRIERIADSKMQNSKKLSVFKARVERAQKLVPEGVVFRLFKDASECEKETDLILQAASS